MLIADGNKKCPRCCEEKLAEGNFYSVNRTSGDGYAGYCIACTKIQAVAWQKNNPDKKRESDRKVRAKRPKKGYFRKWASRKEGQRVRAHRYNQKPEVKLKHRQRERFRRATLTRTFV
jgi:hypothetical protein